MTRPTLLVVLLLAAGAAAAQPRCREGFVWREAFTGDHACVTPERRDAAAADNREALARRQPGGGPYGENTCRPGFVWREGRPGDVVCVTPETRTLTAQENALAKQRTIRMLGKRTHVACPSPEACATQAADARRRVDELRRQKAAKQRDLQRAKAARERAEAKERQADAEWARNNPGLGRTRQPIGIDHVTPLENDIRNLDQALAQAERQAAEAEAAARGGR